MALGTKGENRPMSKARLAAKIFAYVFLGAFLLLAAALLIFLPVLYFFKNEATIISVTFSVVAIGLGFFTGWRFLDGMAAFRRGFSSRSPVETCPADLEKESRDMAGKVRQCHYHVALSFAGEDRQYADELAELLTAAGYKVFYDRYEQSTLWGQNLYTHLSDIYRNQARFCVIFISQHYAQKLWTKLELKAAQAKAFQESREYILPLRLDDVALPGLEETVGYIDLRHHSIGQVFELLSRKLQEQR